MRKLGLGTLRRIVLLIFFALFAAVTLRWISLERWRWTITRAEEPSPTPTAAPSATATATRPPVISGKFDVARLFNGFTLRSEVETVAGAAASEERIDPMSYAIDFWWDLPPTASKRYAPMITPECNGFWSGP